MDQILISFCVTLYNVGEYAENCFKSIIDQNLPQGSFEVVLCDDCSSDDTERILASLVSRYPDVPVRIVRNEQNRGVSYSRNRLIKESNGRFVWFVDGDDMLAENSVKTYLEFLNGTECDVVLGDYYRFNDGEENKLPASRSEAFEKADMNALPTDQNGTRMCAVWCGAFRREFLIENDIKFNERMIAQEDTLFYYETECCRPSVYKTRTVCYLYRQRQSSVMHTRSVERAKNYYLSMREMLRVYEYYRDSRKYINADVIEDKISHSRHNTATCLSAVTDTGYVKIELKQLKKEKIYPYKFYTPILKKGFIRNLIPFLCPIQPFFWLNHFMYKIKYGKND